MNEKIITVVGTNASGKSDLGVFLAKKYNGEILSADSRQIYKGLDLGTGKLTKDEMQGIKHYMVDILDVNQPYSVVDFQQQAYTIIEDIIKRDKLAIIAGGTGLYTRSVVKGYTFNDVDANPELRAELEKQTTEELYQQLVDIDPEVAKRNTKENRRRIIRCLEKYEALGKEGLEDTYEPRYDVLQLGVTWPNDILHERIDERMQRRFDQGMIEEVETLMKQGASDEFLENLGLEYRFIHRYLIGEIKSKADLYDQLGRAIKRFAKQQKTWFKRDKDIKWLDMSGDFRSEACLLVDEFLKK
ncbi:MAG: tRNA (adenosine(37)-N6)-dimethylallyltransferase MiaA [Erysipelotrichaceae bacterium]